MSFFSRADITSSQGGNHDNKNNNNTDNDKNTVQIGGVSLRTGPGLGGEMNPTVVQLLL